MVQRPEVAVYCKRNRSRQMFVLFECLNGAGHIQRPLFSMICFAASRHPTGDLRHGNRLAPVPSKQRVQQPSRVKLWATFCRSENTRQPLPWPRGSSSREERGKGRRPSRRDENTLLAPAVLRALGAPSAASMLLSATP